MCDKYKNKKLFICSVGGIDTDYSVLANDSDEAKKMMVKFINKIYGPFDPPHIVPYDESDIYCMDIESIKEDMIKNNNDIEVL